MVKETITASPNDVKLVLANLKKLDSQSMLKAVLGLPRQIISALDISEESDIAEIPFDQSRIHLFGIGGSAIAGDVVQDMLAPDEKIVIHRGFLPPRDGCGVIVSSYSGNTYEIISKANQIVDGSRSAIFLTSGGELELQSKYLGIPVWKIPNGFQPRAALGWSMGYLVSALSRFKIIPDEKRDLLRSAAEKLDESFSGDDCSSHHLLKIALPASQALLNKNILIYYSKSCTGAGLRLAAQLNENSKNSAFPVQVPEGLHNSIEGIGGCDPETWAVVFISNTDDSEHLLDSLNKSFRILQKKQFSCISIPSIGSNPIEKTLNRIILADFISLFLASLKGVNPTPIPTIMMLKEMN